MRFLIDESPGPPIEESAFEVVERKGLGHPDSICDATMDRVSQALSTAYLERFGRVLHHNADKGLLVAGGVDHAFGGGRVVAPMHMVVAGRATRGLGDASIDVDGVAVEAVRGWFREHLPAVDVERHLRFQVALAPGSRQLTGIFDQPGLLGANDTSAAVGYAPLTETERLTLDCERFLTRDAPEALRRRIGQDVKVMAVRHGRKLDLTVAVPLFDRDVPNEAAYFEAKAIVAAALREHLEPRLRRLDALELHLNALDAPGRGVAGAYLTVIGTSAEAADSGAVGRGNRVNGLIALRRPRGAEAAAGKNPVSHVGKIYSVLAHLLAGRLEREVEGLAEAMVWLVSRIGQPIDRPATIAVQARPAPGFALADLEPTIMEEVHRALGTMPELVGELIRGEHPIC
jgi:S-adenosylmethionine synthetase